MPLSELDKGFGGLPGALQQPERLPARRRGEPRRRSFGRALQAGVPRCFEVEENQQIVKEPVAPKIPRCFQMRIGQDESASAPSDLDDGGMPEKAAGIEVDSVGSFPARP